MALESSKNSMLEKLCASTPLPKMVPVRQYFDETHIDPSDIPSVIREQLSRDVICEKIRPGMKIAVPCGSRGISNIALILRTVVDFLKDRGALPFIFPAMGSHGGALAQGQLQILESYGVTEETMGCPIRATMETVPLGVSSEGNQVYIDRFACEADGILLCGRIKAHTAFRGPYESGLVKMAVIGMGKQKGAESVHQFGFERMARMIPAVGRVIFDNCNIVAGLGIIENAYDRTYQLHALTKDEIWEREPDLLKLAKSKMGRIWINKADILVVDKIGKNFSGDGMDPNVTGTFISPETTDDGSEGPIRTQQTVVLDLSDETHGNGNGIGTATITTRRVLEKIDLDTMYPNSVTAKVLRTVSIPIAMHSDRSAVQLAVRTCIGIDPEHPRIVRIPNSMELGRIYVSEALIPEVNSHPNMKIDGEPEPWPFDEEGNLW